MLQSDLQTMQVLFFLESIQIESKTFDANLLKPVDIYSTKRK